MLRSLAEFAMDDFRSALLQHLQIQSLTCTSAGFSRQADFSTIRTYQFRLSFGSGIQINSRYINEEANVLEGIFNNKLFIGIVGGELLLQVCMFSVKSRASYNPRFL